MRARCIYREEHNDTHVEIWDDGECRSLWFDDVILQSEIHLYDPAVLPNPVNRAMLAHLMFTPRLRRVLLAGCGGGAIARWIHARAPEVAGDAVEISPIVARLAREYFDFPPPDSGWRLLVNDVRAHLAERPGPYDFILVDLEENQETPGWVTGPDFLAACSDCLAPGGTLTLNLLHAQAPVLSEALLRVRAVFGPHLVLLSDPDHDNLLVLAFAGPTPALPAAPALREAGRHWGIDFAALARRARRLEA